eukprot:scaffold316015_cov30-Prasinocladus_malaysianus.AAC.1
MERSIQQLRDERSRAMMEAEAAKEAMAVRSSSQAREESQELKQASSGLHKELKEKLEQLDGQ